MSITTELMNQVKVMLDCGKVSCEFRYFLAQIIPHVTITKEHTKNISR